MSDTILIQPLGEDSCNCKKEIFATHDRFYKNTAPSLQVWTLLSKLGDPHPDAASYGASFTYIGDNVAGTHPSGSYAGNGINGWIVYSVLSITQPVDDSNGHYWILGQPGNFGTFNFNRVNANIEAPLVNAECISIQEIKEKDSCTGVETYRYVTEDGNGILVDASVFIPNFNENKVLFKCVEPLPILEKEICGTIDGSIDNYELIKIYTRDVTTGVSTILHYEDKFGSIITGAVAETCCTCSSLCEVTLNPIANRVCFGYATSFNGGDSAGDRVLNGEQIYLDYLEVDGSVIVNTPILLGATTGGLTLVDVGYGAGYNKVIDIINSSAAIQAAGLTFVTAAGPYANSSYDPMGWGVEYNDTKDVRLVIRDIIPSSSSTHSFSFRLNPDPNQTYDALEDARTATSWNLADVSQVAQTNTLLNCLSI
jgi:hypothetical protein